MNDQVYTAALENASYFRDHNNFRSEALQYGFEQLAKHCQDATPLLDRIRQEAPKYDLGPDTPGNGYRSFLALFDVCFKRCLEVCQAVSRQRTGRSFFLYTAKYIEDLNSWNEVLLSLRAFLDHLNMLLEWNETTNNRHLLIESHPNAHQFLIKAMSIRRYSFYGRHAGFPYSPSIERLFKSMLTFLATYSDYYFNTTGGRFRRIVNFFSDGTRYFLDTEYRARRIVNVSQFASIEFCKSFWFLAQLDFMKKLPQQLMPSLPVVQVISLPPEPLKIKSLGGKIINIPVPSAHGPPAPIPVRLLSSKRRPGMPGASDSDPLIPLSNFLIIHCHGGGFVAQDSESHECYLREWALALDVPILSIDYSLAPEFPFPRQIQEILYVYAWVLNNAHLLGTSAEKIIFIGIIISKLIPFLSPTSSFYSGDSAGATLILGTTLWASDLNLPLPIGLFLADVPLLIRTAPSPSRMLCLLDPLLPFGFMTRCLKGSIQLLIRSFCSMSG